MPYPASLPALSKTSTGRAAALALALAGWTGAPLHAAPGLAPDPDDGGLTLPPGFRAFIAADNLMQGRNRDNLRFITVAPDGVVYAKTYRGGILALRDTNGDGRLDEKQEFGSGGGTGIAIHGDWLYTSTDTSVSRYARHAGDFVPTGEPELIVGGIEPTNQHNAKAFTFDDAGHLLMEVGSPYNVYSDGDRQRGAKGKDATEFLETHGGYWQFDADKPNQTLADGLHYSTGHRHSLAVAWQPTARAYYMVMMGRDQMNTVAPEYYDALDNAERVAEEMHRLHEGVNLGWPYTYWDPIKKARMVAPEFGGDGHKLADPNLYDAPVIAFPAHWAPLQMLFYTGTQFPEHYRGGAFIAFHGSWNRAPLPQDGFNLTYVPFDDVGNVKGTFEVFAANSGKSRFRMGGVALAPDGSLYLSETDRGRIWHIFAVKEGEAPAAVPTVDAKPAPATPPTAIPAPAPKPAAAALSPQAIAGKEVYTIFCATCHMVDGSGSGQLQPPLVGSRVVAGDPYQLAALIIKGPAVTLPPDRPRYSNTMPPFGMLSDQQIADLATYLRAVFADGAGPVTKQTVTAMRTP